MTTLDAIRAVAAEHLDLPADALATLRALTDADLRAVRLVEDLALDSIQLLTLTVEVENHFQIALDVDPLAHTGEEEVAGVEVDTVGDLERLIKRTLAAAGRTQSPE